MTEERITEHQTEAFIQYCIDQAKQKREYELQNPQTRKGIINRLSEHTEGTNEPDTLVSFTNYMAEKTGKNRRVIQNEIRVGEKLLPKNHEAIIKLRLNRKEVYFIAGLPPDYQTAVIEKLREYPDSDIKELAEDLRKNLTSRSHHKNKSSWGLYGFNVILIEDGSDPVLKIASNAVLFLIASEKTFLQELEKITEWGFVYSGIIVIEKPAKKTEFCIIAKRGGPIFKDPVKRLFRCRETDKRPDDFYKALEQATKATKNRIAYFKDKSYRRHGWNVPE